MSVSLNRVPAQSKNIYRVLTDPAPNEVKFTTCNIQPQITSLAKKQKNTTHNENKHQKTPPSNSVLTSTDPATESSWPQTRILERFSRSLEETCSIFFIRKRLVLGGHNREKTQKCSHSIYFVCLLTMSPFPGSVPVPPHASVAMFSCFHQF